MKLNIPWIISRRRFFFATLVDASIIYSFYITIFFKEFKSYPNLIVTISISFFWVICSYILGRYMKCKKFNILEFFKAFLKSSFVFFLCNIIYLSINFSNKILILINGDDFINAQKGQSIFFLKATLLMAFVSCIIQYLLSIMTNKIYSSKTSWIFYGSEIAFNNFMNEIGSNSTKYIFNRINNDFDIISIESDGFEGVIIDNNKELNKDNLEKIFILKSKGLQVINIIKWFEMQLQRIPPFYIENKYQIIDKFDLLDESYKIRIKRIGDFIVSLFLLIITSPLFILISLLIKIEDNGPIFYSQVRTGFKGERIIIFKFRSMIKNAEKYGPQWSTKGDKRITRVGKFIRALRLDELPQLFSVIEGKMSLIGPRPERPEIEEYLLNEIPYYKYRTILKPGISGWAQVNYSYGASKEDTVNKLSYDIYYINHISFFLDLLILIKTIKTIFNAKSHKPIKKL